MATPGRETGDVVGDRLRPLFAPRGVAVIGASRDSAKLGAAMSRNLRCFTGTVVGVNKRDVNEAEGLFASVHDAVGAVGPVIDLAVLCVPASATAAALAEAADAGVRAALVCSGGFAEVGPDGAVLQQDLVAVAAGQGVALLGPNTSGFVVPGSSLAASFAPGVEQLRAGPVAIVAASGGVNLALAYSLDAVGSGVSIAVGIGNGAGVTAADVLRHLATDAATRVVALHVESVTDGAALTDAIIALTAIKPVVALVVGSNDVSDFARSHTGALATSWRTTRAALAAAGAVLVDDERELVDAVIALSFLRLAAGREHGVGIVTAQAGPGLLHFDGLRGADIDVPPLSDDTVTQLRELLPPLTFQRNPVDTGRPGQSFSDVVRTVGADPRISLTSVYALLEPDAIDLPTALAHAGNGPIVVGLGGLSAHVSAQRDRLRDLGVPAVVGPTALTNAVRALVNDARTRIRVSSHPTTSGQPIFFESVPDEHRAKTLLNTLGVHTTSRRNCTDRAQAHRALHELPVPVAVKILDATITHKSDIGGVHLGIRTAAQLDHALDALEHIGARHFLVETMAPDGVDLIVGATRDKVFGPQVLVGLGGVIAEVLADVAVAPAPIGLDDAGALLNRLRGRALLTGYRGGPVVDRAQIAHAIVALGDLVATSPSIEAVEINPLRATGSDVLALDAVITLSTTHPDHGDRT